MQVLCKAFGRHVVLLLGPTMLRLLLCCQAPRGAKVCFPGRQCECTSWSQWSGPAAIAPFMFRRWGRPCLCPHNWAPHLCYMHVRPDALPRWGYVLGPGTRHSFRPPLRRASLCLCALTGDHPMSGYLQCFVPAGYVNFFPCRRTSWCHGSC